MYSKCSTLDQTSMCKSSLLDPIDIDLFSHRESQQSFSSGHSNSDGQGYYSTQSAPSSTVYSDYFSPLPDSSTVFDGENMNAYCYAEGFEPYESVSPLMQTNNYESEPKCYCPDCVKPAKTTSVERPSCSYSAESQPAFPGLYPSGAAPTYIYDEAGVKYEIKKCETSDGQAETPAFNPHASFSHFAVMPPFSMPMVADYRAQRRIPNNPPKAMRMNIPCHVNSKCANCGTTETTLWRRGVNGEVECNACNLFYRKNQRNRPLAMHKKQIKKRKRQPRVYS